MRETKEVERLRLAEPLCCSILGGEPSELDQPSLVVVLQRSSSGKEELQGENDRIQITAHDIIAGELSKSPEIAPLATFKAFAWATISAPGAEEISAQITVLDTGELGYPVETYPGGGSITVDVRAFRNEAPSDPWILSMVTASAIFEDETLTVSQVIEVNYLTGEARKLPPVA